MPTCPKCCGKLTKRKSDNAFHCQSHGKVRDVYALKPLTEEELSRDFAFPLATAQSVKHAVSADAFKDMGI